MVTKSGKFAMLIAAAMMLLPASAMAQNPPSGVQPQNQVQVPQPAQGGVDWQGAGYGAAALFGNLLYIPAKLLYAAGGGLVGGGGYLVTGGNKQVADTIWRSSLGGDYVLTPEMIQGKKPVYFSGPNVTSPPPPNAPAGYSGSLSPSSSAGPGPSVAANSAMSSGGSAIGSSSVPSAGSSSGGGSMDSGAGPVSSGPYRNSGASSLPAAPLPGTSVQ
ncbi:MAG TPA: hypothetical protein VMV15_10465 [Candidatus Binataceae bacterium]|nr:hypothetical protein [Candidatus Binataceae bacterium]